MNPAPGSAFYEPQLAAMPQLREKPRQGFATWKTAWKPGPNVANSTAAIGMRAGLVLEGVRKTYRARYYNPTTGRFLSEDPIGFAGSGPNLYAYAGNDPVDFNDPFGMDKGGGPPGCTGLNCIPWQLLGMAGFGGPRGNPQFNAGQAGVNQPGAPTPKRPWTQPAGPPLYQPPAPGEGQPPPLGPNSTELEALQAAAWTAMQGLSNVDVIVCFSCSFQHFGPYFGAPRGGTI